MLRSTKLSGLVSIGCLAIAGCGSDMDAPGAANGASEQEAAHADATSDAVASEAVSAERAGGAEDAADAELGTAEQGLFGWCENPAGVSGVLAALSVAVALELRRWQPLTDFTHSTSTGLTLSSTGAARCQEEGAVSNGVTCPNVRALLDLQKAPATVQIRLNDGKLVNISELKSKIASAWQAQKLYGQARNHELSYMSDSPSFCGDAYRFYPRYPNSLLLFPGHGLSDSLRFVGYPSNDVLNFAVLYGGTVTVDPSYGLNGSTDTSTGSCDAACTKFSTTSLAGKCCSCGGTNRSFSRATFSPSLYLCQ